MRHCAARDKETASDAVLYATSADRDFGHDILLVRSVSTKVTATPITKRSRVACLCMSNDKIEPSLTVNVHGISAGVL